MDLKYYYQDGSVVDFKKYTIDKLGVIRNKKSGKTPKYHKDKSGYYGCSVYDVYCKKRGIQVGRAIASTFIGKPPTTEHTADHIDRKRNNDTLDNIRWATKKEQNDNQVRPKKYKAAFIVVNDGIEKTIKDWVVYLKGQKNHLGREYTAKMIGIYAPNKQHGFSYKEYPDLSGEEWKEITGSDNKMGRWEISNMCRVKYITKYAENVLSGERLGMANGYPCIVINGTQWYCHILAFMMFFPDKYAAKKPEEMILHKDDDKLDFRPHKLCLGTRSENSTDAHDNGFYDGKKNERVACVSYINGVFEKEHDSQSDAARYLISLGFDKACQNSISNALDKKQKTSYGRTWERSKIN